MSITVNNDITVNQSMTVNHDQSTPRNLTKYQDPLNLKIY